MKFKVGDCVRLKKDNHKLRLKIEDNLVIIYVGDDGAYGEDVLLKVRRELDQDLENFFYATSNDVIYIGKSLDLKPEPSKPQTVGSRYNSGKLRWRNFPLFLIEPLIEVGAAAEKVEGNPNGKYETYNFLNGMYVDDCLDCAKRHLMRAESPYESDYDEELKVHHLAQAAWNCLVALHNIKTRPDLDDRLKTRLAKAKKESK